MHKVGDGQRMKHSDKYAAAKSWNASIQIVRVEWLLECLKQWDHVNESLFLLDEKRQEEDDIPTGDEEDDVDTADEMEVEEPKEKNESESDPKAQLKVTENEGELDDHHDNSLQIASKDTSKDSHTSAARHDPSESSIETSQHQSDPTPSSLCLNKESIYTESNQPTPQEVDAMRALFDDQPLNQPAAKPKRLTEETSTSSKRQELEKPRLFLYSGGTIDPDLRDTIIRLGGNYLETQ